MLSAKLCTSLSEVSTTTVSCTGADPSGAGNEHGPGRVRLGTAISPIVVDSGG